MFSRTAGAFQCILLCGICIDPWNWTGFPTIDLFSERIDKIRGKTHSTSSRCAACKLNTAARSDDLSNKPVENVRRIVLLFHISQLTKIMLNKLVS